MGHEERDSCMKYAAHFARLSGVSVIAVDLRAKEIFQIEPAPCQWFGQKCPHTQCVRLHTHTYGLNEAARWGGKYIYYCPVGLVFAASVLPYEESFPSFGLVAGPVILGDADESLTEPSLNRELTALPQFSADQVNSLAEVLSAVCCAAAGKPRNARIQSLIYSDREEILKNIYDAQEATSRTGFYPLHYEEDLCATIRTQDKKGAQALLNDLLGYIFVSGQFDLGEIKTRIIELIVLLSRASIDAGADSTDTLLHNTDYIRQINQVTSMEELSEWVTGVMNRFIGDAFDYTNVKHSDIVHKTMEYIKANYSRKISLDDVARHVYLSRAYLSSLFKKETGQSLTACVNRIRIEKSKALLRNDRIKLVEIAGLCGFEDQSYYTKVFKKEVGMSPKKFRDAGGKI